MTKKQCREEIRKVKGCEDARIYPSFSHSGGRAAYVMIGKDDSEKCLVDVDVDPGKLLYPALLAAVKALEQK